MYTIIFIKPLEITSYISLEKNIFENDYPSILAIIMCTVWNIGLLGNGLKWVKRVYLLYFSAIKLVEL